MSVSLSQADGRQTEADPKPDYLKLRASGVASTKRRKRVKRDKLFYGLEKFAAKMAAHLSRLTGSNSNLRG